MCTLAMLSALFLLTFAATAHAQGGPTGFQSPSKNIACQYFDYDRQNVLRCDIMEAVVTVRRPANCDLEWGRRFEMRSKGNAERLCYGDTVMDSACRYSPTATCGSVADSPARRGKRG